MQPPKRPDPKSPPPNPDTDQLAGTEGDNFLVQLAPFLDLAAKGCSGMCQNCKKRDAP